MFLVKFLSDCLFLIAAKKAFNGFNKFKTCFFILKVSYEINTIILKGFLKPCTIVQSHASRNSNGPIFLCFLHIVLTDVAEALVAVGSSNHLSILFGICNLNIFTVTSFRVLRAFLVDCWTSPA
jgi:hypothetical protein